MLSLKVLKLFGFFYMIKTLKSWKGLNLVLGQMIESFYVKNLGWLLQATLQNSEIAFRI